MGTESLGVGYGIQERDHKMSNPKFRVTFIVEVGEECDSIEEHKKALALYFSEGAAFSQADIAVVGDVQVDEV